jgi:DnaJ like chaperone protein
LFKWILAIAGFLFFGKSFFGGFIGFTIGSGIDNYQNRAKSAQGRGDQRGGRAFSPEDLFNYYQQRSSTSDIPTMIMALSAAVMRADGKVLKSELTYVKTFLNQQFGTRFSTEHLQVLKRFLDSGDIPLHQICQDIKLRMQPEVRTQLLHYMFGIAKADGEVSQSEIDVIKQIASMLGVSQTDFESVKNMFYRNVDSDYKVLGIEQTSTDDEVKKAYRKMAIKFHPDKVVQMGVEYQKGAKEKFQKIQDSYEAIKKRRGIK